MGALESGAAALVDDRDKDQLAPPPEPSRPPPRSIASAQRPPHPLPATLNSQAALAATTPHRGGYAYHGAHHIAYLLHNEHLLADPDVVPLVVVHGLSMSVRFWELAMLPEIEHGLPWLSVSLPLHYPSVYEGDALEAPLDVAAFAKTLGETIAQVLGPQRRVLVAGHSVGAMSAMAYAAFYPERCAGVFSVGGFTTGRAKGLEGGLQLLTAGKPLTRSVFRAVWRAKQRSLRFTNLIVHQYATDKAALDRFAPFAPTLRLVHPDMARHNIDGVYQMMRQLYHLDLLPFLAHIRCPVWAVAGTDDPVVDYEHQVTYASAIPRGSLHAIEGAGHLSFAERPTEFNELLLSFLNC